MKCAVLGGTGWQGAGVATRIVAAGHQATIGSRTLARAEYLARRLPEALDLPAGLFSAATNIDAATDAEIVFVVAPITGHRELLSEIQPFVQGKIVVDVTAPVDPHNQLVNLWPAEGSATQEAQAVLGSDVEVVGALKNISATALLNYRKPSNCDVLVVGDDLSAKQQVIGILRQMKLPAFDVGAGDVCRTVEGLTSLLIYLNYAYHLRQPSVKIAQIDPGLDFIPPADLLPK